MAAARKRAKTNTLEPKVRRIINKMWRQWLASSEDRILTLDPEKYVPGVQMTLVVGVRFGFGNRRATKQVQRTFSTTKRTKVPGVLAEEFLKSPDVIDTMEAA